MQQKHVFDCDHQPRGSQPDKVTKAMIWKTDEDPEKIGEYEIARNIEVRDNGDGCIEVRVTQKTLRTDEVSLPKLLSPIEAIRMGAALINAARIDERGELRP